MSPFSSPPAGYLGSAAFDTSPNGQFIGGFVSYFDNVTGQLVEQAAVWDNRVVTPLTHADGTPFQGRVLAVADNGLIGGTTFTGPGGQAFIYHPDWAEPRLVTEYLATEFGVTLPSTPVSLNGIAMGADGRAHLALAGSAIYVSFQFEAPRVEELQAEISGPADGVRGQPRTFTVAVTEPEDGKVYTWSFDWDGNGTVDEILDGPSGASVSHVFPASGSFTVGVTVEQDDGSQSDPAGMAVTIMDVAMQEGGKLAVGGTGDRDKIKFTQSKGEIFVTINRTRYGPFTPSTPSWTTTPCLTAVPARAAGHSAPGSALETGCFAFTTDGGGGNEKPPRLAAPVVRNTPAQPFSWFFHGWFCHATARPTFQFSGITSCTLRQSLAVTACPTCVTFP
jgi:hypothetical protein